MRRQSVRCVMPANHKYVCIWYGAGCDGWRFGSAADWNALCVCNTSPQWLLPLRRVCVDRRRARTKQPDGTIFIWTDLNINEFRWVRVYTNECMNNIKYCISTIPTALTILILSNTVFTFRRTHKFFVACVFAASAFFQSRKQEETIAFDWTS